MLEELERQEREYQEKKEKKEKNKVRCYDLTVACGCYGINFIRKARMK